MHRITMRNLQKDLPPVSYKCLIAISFMQGRCKSSRHLGPMALYSMFRFKPLFGCFSTSESCPIKVQGSSTLLSPRTKLLESFRSRSMQKEMPTHHVQIAVAFTAVERMPIYPSYIGPVISFRKLRAILNGGVSRVPAIKVKCFPFSIANLCCDHSYQQFKTVEGNPQYLLILHHGQLRLHPKSFCRRGMQRKHRAMLYAVFKCLADRSP